MKKLLILSCGILLGLADIKMIGAQVSNTVRDAEVQSGITHQLAEKKEFRDVQSAQVSGAFSVQANLQIAKRS